MRTVDAALTAALAAGNPTPYLKAYVGWSWAGTKNSHTNVVSYTLTGTSLEFVIPYDNNYTSDQDVIWLERGLTIAGTTYTVTTGRFFITEEEYLPGGFARYKGFIFPHQYYSATGDVTYETVIDAFCLAFGKTASFKDEAEAWLDYQFLPAGQVIIVNSAMRVLNMLQAKRLVVCCDNGSEDIRFYSADTMPAADVTIALKDEFSIFTTKTKRRQYVYRDENETVYLDGDATDPLHNLGYLESTDSPPVRNTQTLLAAAYVRPDLRLQDGDVVQFTFDGGTKSANVFAQVTEIFDSKTTNLPKWRMLVEANPIFHATEGGAMPSTIERVSNYTPLNTSHFGKVLSANDNNLQAAMDRIDDHTHREYDYFGIFAAGQATDDFTLALAAGWTWAGAPFVTPSTVEFTNGQLRIGNGTTAARAFLYRTASTAPDHMMRAILRTNYVGAYVGIRFDDGTDDNYIEYILRYQAANNYDLAKIIRTGGGAVTTTAYFNLGVFVMWYILELNCNGTKFTNWNGNPTHMIDSPGTLSPGAIGAGLTWTPTRAGISFQTGTASWQRAYIDWFKVVS